MNYLFPIFIKPYELNILIVGAGNVALEKMNAILRNSPKANITICAPWISDGVRDLAKEYNLPIIQENYNNIYLQKRNIVIATTDDLAVNKQISIDCRTFNILVNVADTPDLCDFYLGSVVHKGDLKIGISTNGKSPTLARRMKEMLNEILPDNIQDTLDNLNEIRKTLKGDFAEKIRQLNEITKTLKSDKK